MHGTKPTGDLVAISSHNGADLVLNTAHIG
jgi:hypothetical protein